MEGVGVVQVIDPFPCGLKPDSPGGVPEIARNHPQKAAVLNFLISFSSHVIENIFNAFTLKDFSAQFGVVAFTFLICSSFSPCA